MHGKQLVLDGRREGALAPGQLADLAVLSADYFSIPEEEIKQLESVLTIVGGKVVYATAEFSTRAAGTPGEPQLVAGRKLWRLREGGEPAGGRVTFLFLFTCRASRHIAGRTLISRCWATWAHGT